MTETKRQQIIAGNWKMHFGPVETNTYVRAFVKLLQPTDRTIILVPPAVSIATTAEALSRSSEIRVGVQNIHWEEKGAFTGETGARMAVSAGASWALCGHSERRKLFGETDEQVAAYEAANELILESLPGVPLAHPVPSLAFAPEIQGYQQSPVQDEVWNVVSIEE